MVFLKNSGEDKVNLRTFCDLDFGFCLGAWPYRHTQAAANAGTRICSLLETVKAKRMEAYLWLCRV